MSHTVACIEEKKSHTLISTKHWGDWKEEFSKALFMTPPQGSSTSQKFHNINTVNVVFISIILYDLSIVKAPINWRSNNTQYLFMCFLLKKAIIKSWCFILFSCLTEYFCKQIHKNMNFTKFPILFTPHSPSHPPSIYFLNFDFFAKLLLWL